MGKEVNAINSENPESVVNNNVKETTTDTNTEKISVESSKLKDKILLRTDKLGATQNGKVAKGFVVGTIFGILLVLGFNLAKDKGYIKIK